MGPFEVADGDHQVALGGPKQRALLAALVLARGETLSSDRLIDQLWGERPPATAATTLRVYVSNLRKSLGDGVVLTRGGGYMLAPAAGTLDADRFNGLVAEARGELADGDPARASELFAAALDLWRGDPLADLAYESFAQGEIARLTEARLSALEDRIEADLALGRHRDLVGELEDLCARHPHRERLLGQLMVALYRSGRHADALEAYRKGRRALDQELGLEPGPALRALEQRILAHDPGLDVPAAPRSLPRQARRAGPRGPRTLIAAGGAVLLAAAIAAGAVKLSGGGAQVRAAPNSVAEIDVGTDQVTAAVPVGARPGAIAIGSGSLWVANRDDQTVSRVDPATLREVRTISLADPPTGIAVAGGAVWVTASNATATYVSASRIDPQFDAVDRTVKIGNVAPGSPPAIAAASEGLWVAPFSGEVTRLDPQSGTVTARLDPNAAPAGVAIGTNALWITDSTADTVTRIDTTGLTEAIPVGHSPSGIALGAGGVWVADTSDDAVVRIDPQTRAVIATIPVGATPVGVAIGAGSVWVANSGDGTVSRINPATDKVTATITVGGSPQRIAISGGHAWVTVDAPQVRVAGPASGGTLRIDSPNDVTSMDPALAYDSIADQLLEASCAKLINFPDKPGAAGSQLVPEVAQSLPLRSADGRTYTFTIRPGFRFSPPSDQPVTAATFKYTIERTLNPKMKSPVASEFSDIVGATAYMSGKASELAGVTAAGNTLVIRLTEPHPDLVARLANPAMCAVPTDTPIDPRGVRDVPSAGPYYVVSYAPGQGIVLARNPNYHGNRPRGFARIEVTVNTPANRAVAQVESGVADYIANGPPPAAGPALSARFGAGSAAAKRGRQQYFVNPLAQVDLLVLNTHRPLFANRRLRLAVSYAIDRAALAHLGDEYAPAPEHPTDHYLPPGMPGYSNIHIYPLMGDVTKARALAAGLTPAKVVLYTCNVSPCDQQAQIIKTDLARIGLQVQAHFYPDQILYARAVRPGEPFDMIWLGWVGDYLDPDSILNFLLEDGSFVPTFVDPVYRRRLAAVAQLSGPARYLAYARLDADLARNAAPLVAFGNLSNADLFSARVGCQIYGVYGMDLAALCLRKR